MHYHSVFVSLFELIHSLRIKRRNSWKLELAISCQLKRSSSKVQIFQVQTPISRHNEGMNYQGFSRCPNSNENPVRKFGIGRMSTLPFCKKQKKKTLFDFVYKPILWNIHLHPWKSISKPDEDENDMVSRQTKKTRSTTEIASLLLGACAPRHATQLIPFVFN